MTPRVSLVGRLTIAVLSCLVGAVGCTRDLSEEEARRLVLQALPPTQRRLQGLDVGLAQTLGIPDFYRFEVVWDNPNSGSVVVGFFAVNRATGDVWEQVLCSKKKSRGLKKLQEALRKQVGLSQDELRKLTGKSPCD